VQNLKVVRHFRVGRTERYQPPGQRPCSGQSHAIHPRMIISRGGYPQAVLGRWRNAAWTAPERWKQGPTLLSVGIARCDMPPRPLFTSGCT
jgi:hypothetical protein